MDAQFIDRQLIAETLTRYAVSLDGHDWAALETVFTLDATTEYGSWGGGNTGRDEIVETCRVALTGLDASQHLVSNYQIEVDGDTATASSVLQALHALKDAPGDGDTFIVFGTYKDRLVRTAEGWRIQHRELVPTWSTGNVEVVSRVQTHAAVKAGLTG